MPPSKTDASPAAAASASKSSSKLPKSRIVTLKLSPKSLTKFPHEDAISSSTPSRAKSVSSSTPSAATPSNPVAEQTPVANGADSNEASTPAATSNGMLAPPSNAARRKGVPGPKPGMKRTASQLDPNGAPKPRGKPGPKKKPRIGENGEVINGAQATAPKLGPKANQGAINACLRALDRSGKPCRRWEKKPFTVRSFTGYNWGSDTYASFRKPATEFAGDVKSDSSSAGDVKPAQDSSAVMSEKSTSGADADIPMLPAGITDSPAPAVTVNPSE